MRFDGCFCGGKEVSCYTMYNYYRILGVSTAASNEEIRRAYRILARRYHPDVNPGKSSEEKFKQIAEAYAVLSDAIRRRQHDAELDRGTDESFTSHFERAHEAYRKQQSQQESRQQHQRSTGQRRPRPHTTQPPPGAQRARPKTSAKRTEGMGAFLRLSRQALRRIRQRVSEAVNGREAPGTSRISQVSLIEVSVSISEAIAGVRRTVEVSDENGGHRKISVTIPPGVRTGSVVRFRRKEDPSEEMVLIIRVATHPWISITHKGLMIEVPISLSEAIQGARIQVPSLGEPLLVSVAPGTQSGTEVRLRNQGIQFRDGTHGDLFVRFMIKLPESPDAVGLKDRASELDRYYAKPVRQHLPRSLMQA